MSKPQDWHALGFNPARGNPQTVGALARQMTDTGNWLAESYEVLDSVRKQQDVWTGEASKAFAEKLGELPGLLDDAHQSLTAAGKALGGWQDTLTEHQRKAVDLENRAREAIAAAERADAAAQQARQKADTSIAYDADDPEAAQAARRQVQANADAAAQANRNAEEAWAHVDDIRRKAHDLQDRWEDDARSVADKLRDATAVAPGFWDAIGDAFADLGNYVADHLGEIGDFAGIAAAVAGTLALIPGVNVAVGAVALIAGGIALAAHGGEMAVEGKWDEPTAWVGLGTDALGMLPVVGPAAKGGAAATDALHMADGLTTAVGSGAKIFGDEMSTALTRMKEPAEFSKYVGDKVVNAVGGNVDTIARAGQGAFNVITQGPVVADHVVGNDTTGTLKDGTGYASLAGAGAQSYGEWKNTGSAFGDLGGSIADFTKALK
ncbi:hypothetical protein DFQ14_103122 [Halopolyspora algeriensis]|uniref:Type VII secretion system (Wss) protein ESAT-6 n=1 Tax=Halopolyspora algeriensis TaxID=1500506 RepID=A0A368VWP5_9ACTN|nr:hypothetical protein [Halopolyspora algeriensis]RCW45158.1 hypothetical protein DFQ14_103122 [Halopolyspora algeriensis]TQM53123.1 hypothetical protein FHU43_2502 [Halopolyspora algeriensis]